MRHRYNRLLEFNSGIQKKDNVLRNMLTSLLREKRITTTPKKAKVVKHEADKLFARLVRTSKKYKEEDVSKREVKRILDSIIYDKNVVTEIMNDKLSTYLESWKVSWFVKNYKVGYRKGDAVEKIMLELV